MEISAQQRSAAIEHMQSVPRFHFDDVVEILEEAGVPVRDSNGAPVSTLAAMSLLLDLQRSHAIVLHPNKRSYGNCGWQWLGTPA